MVFSIELLTTVSEVDALIALANRDKRALELRKQNLAFRTENSAEDVAERAAELTKAQAELATLNTVISSLADGDRKEDEITKRMEVEVKIRKLTRGRLSAVSRLENEYDLDQLDRQLAGIEAFITALNTRKAAL